RHARQTTCANRSLMVEFVQRAVPRGYLANRSGAVPDAANKDSRPSSVHSVAASLDSNNHDLEEVGMAKISKVMVGESLVGEGNEVAHVDLLIGPRGSAVETAFRNALTNNKYGFTTLLAVIARNLACKPNTV